MLGTTKSKVKNFVKGFIPLAYGKSGFMLYVDVTVNS